MRAHRSLPLCVARLIFRVLGACAIFPLSLLLAQNAPLTPGNPNGFPLVPPPVADPATTAQMPPGSQAATQATVPSSPTASSAPTVPSLPSLDIPDIGPVTPGMLAALPADDPLLQPDVDLTLPTPGQPQPPSEIQLDQILAYAAMNSPTMREQKDTVAQFDAARFRSWVRNMPAINGTYNVGLFYQASQKTTSGNDLVPGGAYTIELTHPLWAWGAYDATRDLAFLKERIAQNNALIAYSKLCLVLRKLYYGLAVQKAEVALRASQLQTASRRLETERLLLASGRSTRNQVNRLELDRDNLAIKKMAADNAYQYQFNEFRRLSGLRGFADLDVPAQIYLPVVNHQEITTAYADYEKSGFDQSPAALENTLNQDALEQQVIIARAQQKPQVNFSAGITQTPLQNTNNNSLGFSTIIFVGVAGTWNIFDRFETRDKVRALLAEKRVAETRLKDEREQSLNESANNMSQIFLGLHSLAILRHQWAQAQADYQRVLILLNHGRAGQTLLDGARDNLLDLKFQILTRRAEVANSYYNFLASLFRDPALINLPQFALPRSS